MWGGRRELTARTLFVHLDRDDKGEMTVTNVAVSASRKSNGNSAFYRTDDLRHDTGTAAGRRSRA